MAEKQTKSDRAEDGNADNTANMASCLCQKKKQSKKKRTKKMEHLQVWMWMSVLDTESMSDIKEHLRLHFFLE